MTKAEAKRRLCAGLAASLQADLGYGDAWPHQGVGDEVVSNEDRARIDAAGEELIAELERRAGLK